ncbi:MAG: dTDP-glucose 4,6-dehydratase [Deltaproteobacteria bacterium]
MKVLVTGGAGFIGANYVLRRLRTTDDQVTVVDALTYAGNLESLQSVEKNPALKFHRADITDAEVIEAIFEEAKPDAVVHFAAESHVDRSILGPRVFTSTNVLGTQVLLDASKKQGVQRFVMVSTDEVYGSLGKTGLFTETSPLKPSSPYSASKAAADLVALSYHHTFGMDVVVTRCSNNYGPLQFPEKLIPLMIINALEDKPLPVYGDGMQVRDWIHVEDHCAAIDAVFAKGTAGEVYNIGSQNERPNIEIVQRILAHLGKPESLIRHVEDRLGHDRRYAIDPTKTEGALGWVPEKKFEDALPATIDWYLANRDWWERVRSGAYREYFEANYAKRLAD